MIRRPPLFRVVTFLPRGAPCVVVRPVLNFRRASDLYRSRVDQARALQGRVQIQHAVPEIVGYDASEGWVTRLVWRVVLDSKALGNVHGVANPGAARRR